MFENRMLRWLFDSDGEIEENEMSRACRESRSSDSILVRKADGKTPLVKCRHQ
jgi:hypothetical protein